MVARLTSAYIAELHGGFGKMPVKATWAVGPAVERCASNPSPTGSAVSAWT